MRNASTRCRRGCRINRLTPVRPSSASGWRTEVSCGVTIVAWLGVVEPDHRQVVRNAQAASLRAACSAPIATLSLKPKIAVGGSGSESSSLCRLRRRAAIRQSE